jgi:hypothetical protein
MMDTSCRAGFLDVFLFPGEDVVGDGEERSGQGWIMVMVLLVMADVVLQRLLLVLWRMLLLVVGEEMV